MIKGIRRILLTSLTLATISVGTISPVAATSAEYRSDASQYNGATTEIGFRLQRGPKARTFNAYQIEMAVDLPPAWANRYGAYAQIRVNGLTVATTGWMPDTNGDGRLEFYSGDLWLHRGDRVSAWFSDPVSRYTVSRAEVRV